MFPAIKKLVQRDDWIFVQDSAPSYRSNLVQDFLEKILKRRFVKCVEWPPSSPDVNPLDSLDPVDPLLLGFCKNEGILMQSWTAIQFRRRIKNKNKSCLER